MRGIGFAGAGTVDRLDPRIGEPDYDAVGTHIGLDAKAHGDHGGGQANCIAATSTVPRTSMPASLTPAA